MCNKLHPKHQYIPEEGFGYKVFRIMLFQGLVTCFRPKTKIVIECYQETRGWFRYYKYLGDGDGFCFFPTIQGAKSFMELRGLNRVIRKIEYRKGLGKHIETKMIRGHSFTIALCKEFRVIEDK